MLVSWIEVKKVISASKYILNGKKRGSRYWAYDL